MPYPRASARHNAGEAVGKGWVTSALVALTDEHHGVGWYSV